MLSLDRDINLTSGTYRAACSNSTAIIACSDTPDLRIYDWNGKQTNTAVTLPGTPSGIVLGALATAVVAFTSAQVSFVNITTNQITTVSAGAAAAATNSYGQQIAASLTDQIVMVTRGSGTVSKINVATQVITTLSPSSITGGTTSCILFKPDTRTFLVGTANGKVTEIDLNGAPLKTINLINTPNITAPVITVSGLSYYNDKLAITTGHGLTYFYTYSTSTLNYIMQGHSRPGGIPTLTSLTDSASGTFLMARGGGAQPNASCVLTECCMISTIPTTHVLNNEAANALYAAGIEPSLSKAWAIFGTSAAQGPQLRIFNLTPLQYVTEPTRSNDPLGIDVAVRIIRIRTDEIGREMVEIDQNVSSGSQNVLCSDGHQYIELALEAGGTERWDIREFTS